ncbi:MAG TPA: histidinol dehydrogenase [Acidimicrobiia bacterium]|nr:histidinol dehydrogenase [Acidimicrobiia bacterium]
MLTRLDLRGVADLAAALPAPDADDEPRAAARDLIREVRAGGDAALRAITRRFDGCDVDAVAVSPAVLVDALARAEPEFRAALAHAATAIRAYHEAQVAEPAAVERDGITVRELDLPVARAGCYVPGGRAAYPSTVLMTVIPAQVAGVHEIVLCTPPGPDGEIAASTLAAAEYLGVDEVYRVGGAQAIAALTYGTETIRPVDVIVGPGNAYVAAAKREVVGTVGIDSLAGPSEVVVVADATAPPEFVAADLLAQAEHGPGGTAVVITWDTDVADAVDRDVELQLGEIERADDARATLASGGRIVLVDGPLEAIAAVNVIAPEHLQLMTADPDALLEHVRNAGAVFLGPWAPAALGDYVAGVNHVLPTARTARFASALRVDTFRKHVHVVEATAAGLAGVADHIEALAEVEGLDAHARSVRRREAFTLSEERR